MRNPIVLKALRKDPDGSLHSCYGGTQTWVPGEWVAVAAEGDLCTAGWLHVARWNTPDLLSWLKEEVWLAEWEGRSCIGSNKMGVQRLRLVRRCDFDRDALRLFAADCAERALVHFETRFPDDKRPRLVVEGVRQFVAGKIDRAALRTLENDARRARDAAAAAAAAAADAATYARYAAAAPTAETAWQTQRLMAYLTGWRPAGFAHHSSH